MPLTAIKDYYNKYNNIPRIGGVACVLSPQLWDDSSNRLQPVVTK